MTTTAELITSVRGNTFQTDTTRLPDTLIVQWANEEQDAIHRYIASIAPHLFLTVSANLTVASGLSTIDISSLTTLEQIQEVKRLQGSVWKSIRPAGYNPETSSRLCWRQRGASAIDLFPANQAPGTYRVEYTAGPTALSTSLPNAVIALPGGGARVLIEGVSARVRAREEEDPSVHLQWREQAWKDLRANLMPKTLTLIDVTGRY